ncbi:MAG: aldo/keto reductase [Bdellovibrio sp.]|nr:aldo/keto reductase [Bdellovibrio sp.]
MEYRRLGKSGLMVPVLSFGTATFGGTGEFFKAWGSTDVKEAKRLIDLCMEAELNFFDTANGYSRGAAEEILGEAILGKRQNMILSTKSTFPTGAGANDYGSSRKHVIEQCEASLRRLKTDYIDVYHMHGMDSHTPVEETLMTLETLIQSGKVRYIACSNFSAWHLMKSLSTSEKLGLNRYVAHQIYYSLVGRDAEWELLPLGTDQGVGSIIWSPLAGGALSGKITRKQAPSKESRLGQIKFVHYNDEILFSVVDVLEQIAREREKTIPQVALNWILRKPTVANIIVGARNEEQLKQNLGAIGWKLSEEEVIRLDKAGKSSAPYPYWHQQSFPQLVPSFAPITQ